MRGPGRARRGLAGRRGMPAEERGADQYHQRRHLQTRERTLHPRPFLDPDVVHRREHRDQRHRDRLPFPRRQPHEVADIDREGDRQPRAAAREHRQHERPAADEGAQRSVGFPQVHVLPARRGKHRAQFRVGQRAEEREHAANHPRRDNPGVRRHVARDHIRQHKNARADHDAHDDRRGIYHPQPARQIARDSTRRRHLSYSPAPRGSARPCAFPPRPY